MARHIYTNRQTARRLPAFNDYWIPAIEQRLGCRTDERPSNVGKPISKNWFLTQFDAEGITYKIGDNTPRDMIVTKGRISAQEMMKLLLYKCATN